MAKAQVVVEMSSDEAKLFRGMQKIVAQQRKMEDGWKKNKKESDKGFGSGAVRNLKNYVTNLVGVTVAVTAVTTALRGMEAERERAGQRDRQSRIGMAQLAQLANTPAEMKLLLHAARSSFSQGGFADQGEAARLVFSLQSAGALNQRQLFTSLKSQGLVEEPALMARAAKTLQTSMGTGETGTMRNLVSKSFAASAFSPASAESLLESASRSGGSARALGISDEEVLAATALLATSTGTAELGGTQLASFLKSIDKKGTFGGLGISKSVSKIESMGLKGEKLQKFFGRAEALAGFRTLSANQAKFGEITAAVHQGQADDIVTGKLKLADVDPNLRAAKIQSQAQAKLQNAQLKSGRLRNITQSMLSQDEQRIREGDGVLPAWLEIAGLKARYGTTRLLGNEEALLRGAVTDHGGYTRETFEAANQFKGESGDVQNQQLEILKQISERSGVSMIKPLNTNEE